MTQGHTVQSNERKRYVKDKISRGTLTKISNISIYPEHDYFGT